MNSHLLASLVDGAIPFLGGLYLTLLAHRWVGPKPGQNPKYDGTYESYIRWGKWGGPLLMLFGVYIFIKDLAGG